jgi:translation initiation factor IF-2
VYTLHSSKKSKNISAAAGCRVTHGQIDLAVGRRFRVVRGGESVFEGELVSLKHLKDEVQLMKKGGECGLTLEGFGAYERGDTVQQLIEKRSRRLVNMPVYDVASFDLDKLQFGSSGFGQKRNSTQEAQKSL